MISNNAVASMALVITAVMGNGILAAEPTAAELYGQAVHAYFAADYDSAITLLSESIRQNGADPRAYYFRGLTLASQQGLDAGLADFAKGADVEVNRLDRKLYDVNGALQRVQGGLRLALEQQRSAVRRAAAERKKRQDRIKYERLKRREDYVLFQPDRPVKKIDFKLPKVDLAGKDPFATGVAFTGGKQVRTAALAVDKRGADGAAPSTDGDRGEFRDPFAAPVEKPDDPFADSSRDKKSPKAEMEPGSSNPFGEGAIEVPPDHPVFDKNVRPELPAGMDVGGTIMDLLNKTLSGKPSESKNRDPFGEDEPETPPKAESDDSGSKPEKKPEPIENPFD